MAIFVAETTMTSTDWMWSVVQHTSHGQQKTPLQTQWAERRAYACMDGRSITYNQSPVNTLIGCYFLYCRPLLYLCLSAQFERPIKRSNRKYRVLNKLRKRNGASLFIARHFARFLHLCTMVLKPHIHQRIVCQPLSPTVHNSHFNQPRCMQKN